MGNCEGRLSHYGSDFMFILRSVSLCVTSSVASARSTFVAPHECYLGRESTVGDLVIL